MGAVTAPISARYDPSITAWASRGMSVAATLRAFSNKNVGRKMLMKYDRTSANVLILAEVVGSDNRDGATAKAGSLRALFSDPDEPLLGAKPLRGPEVRPAPKEPWMLRGPCIGIDEDSNLPLQFVRE